MTGDPLLAFGRAMRARRKALQLTQEAAADRAQMDMSYWGKIERGRIDPGLRMVARIAIALATNPAQLLGGAAPPTIEEEIVITLTRRGESGAVIGGHPSTASNPEQNCV